MAEARVPSMPQRRGWVTKDVQKIAWVFGAAFTLAGILGFIPGITFDGKLLGIFEVDAVENITHLGTGALALIAAGVSAYYSKLYFRAFGVVYGLVTIVGFVQGTTVLGLFVVNTPDNFLHLLIAVVALVIGFGVKSD